MDDALGRQPRHLAAVLTGQLAGGRLVGTGDAGRLAAGRGVRRDGRRDRRAGARAAGRRRGRPGIPAAVPSSWPTARCSGTPVSCIPRSAGPSACRPRTAAAEIDLDALIAAAPASGDVPPISGFPVAKEDVALIVDADVPAAAVERALRAGAGPLLESVDPVRRLHRAAGRRRARSRWRTRSASALRTGPSPRPRRPRRGTPPWPPPPSRPAPSSARSRAGSSERFVAVVGGDGGDAPVADRDELGDVGGQLLAGDERADVGSRPCPSRSAAGSRCSRTGRHGGRRRAGRTATGRRRAKTPAACSVRVAPEGLTRLGYSVKVTSSVNRLFELLADAGRARSRRAVPARFRLEMS